MYVGSKERKFTFRYLRKNNLCPIKYLKICGETGEQVEFKDLVKGYEYQKGKFGICRKEQKLKLKIMKTKININNLPKSKFPSEVKPMFAKLVSEPFDREGWLFEIKWDGYRAISYIQNQNVTLCSRNNKPFENFPEIIESLKLLPFDAVLDGEIVALDKNGKADFQLLQNYLRTGKGILVYYVFDVLFFKDFDLMNFPLVERKKFLKEILPDLPNLRISEHIEKQGRALFETMKKNGIEGIMAKKIPSPYRPGERTGDWLKIKTHNEQEAVIVGFTKPRGSRKKIGSLVLGIYDDDGNLVNIGNVGSGFDEKMLASLYEELKKYQVAKSPLVSEPKLGVPVTWVRPELVCQVKFVEWTADGHLRQPVFLGLREDKKPKEVKWERAEKNFRQAEKEN